MEEIIQRRAPVDIQNDNSDGLPDNVSDGSQDNSSDGSQDNISDGSQENVSDGIRDNSSDSSQENVFDWTQDNSSDNRLVWLFAINRTTIPRIYNCSELVCAIVDLGIVGLSVMCAYYWHNLFIYLCKN